MLGSVFSLFSPILSILQSQFNENLPALESDHPLYLIKYLILHFQYHITLAFFLQEISLTPLYYHLSNFPFTDPYPAPWLLIPSTVLILGVDPDLYFLL